MILISAFACSKSLAGPADYLMDVWTSDNDLPDSSVTAIAQTRDGYLWVGTYNGLARFDGVRFVTFDPVTTPQLRHAWITGLFVDAWGTLWVNTYDGSMTSLRDGVFNCEWQGGQVASVFSSSDQLFFSLGGHRSQLICRTESGTRHGEWKRLPLAGSVTGNSFRQDGSGTIWYTVNRGIYRIVGTNSESMTQTSGWRGNSVTCMSVDPGGHLWIGTDEGVARWNSGRFEDWTPTNGPATVNAYSLFCTMNGTWVFGDGKVRKCADRQWVAEVDAKSWRDLVGTFALDLNGYEDRDGGVWFTHLGSGLFHIDADGHAEHFSTANGLPSNLARCWFQDREGNIWAGLGRGGLVHLRKREFQVIGPAEGLGALAVSSICEDGRSNVWIGTFSGGLYRWRDGKLDRFNLPDGAYRDCFFSAYPDSQNRLWLSAGREDLFMFDEERIVPAPTAVHGVKTILADRKGRVWFGKPAGLSCLTGDGLRGFSSTNGLSNIRSLAEDRDGVIWVGTGEGNLFCYNGKSFVRYHTSDGQESRAIWSLLPRDDGTLWVGTFRGGLLRFKDGKFTRYTTQDGLPSDIVCQILDDGRGNLWIGSYKGIFSVAENAFADFDVGKIKSLPCVSYGLSDGLPALECSGNYQPSCWRDHDGRLWFATARGAVSVVPTELSRNKLPPPVQIEEIFVDGKRQARVPASGSLLIPPGEHQLDFYYTALSFVAPNKVTFRYRLRGVDSDWVDGGTKRSAHYGPLRPGRYSFQVSACNSDGVWNEAGATLAFRVQPAWWQIWWVQALALALAATVLVLGVRRWSLRRLTRKLARLEQQQALERERTRIARDLHDDLGATVTQVHLMVEELAHTPEKEQWHTQAGEISGRVRNLARDLDAVVWSVNPGNDSLNKLSGYLGEFFLETLRRSAVRPRLQVEEGIPNVPLKPEVRHHVFLVTKEATNNIIKHSGATEATLAIAMKKNVFEVRILDNGRGFDVEVTARSMRNGVRNMRARAEEMGCGFEISSRPGGGTEICLRLPLRLDSDDRG